MWWLFEYTRLTIQYVVIEGLLQIEAMRQKQRKDSFNILTEDLTLYPGDSKLGTL